MKTEYIRKYKSGIGTPYARGRCKQKNALLFIYSATCDAKSDTNNLKGY